MFKWINQEMKNLEAMQKCFENLQKVMLKITERKEVIVDLSQDLETVESNRTTMKRFWQTVTGRANNKETLLTKIALEEAEADGWQNIADYLLAYLPTVVIPHFQKECEIYYFKFLEGFAGNHIEYSCESVKIWSQIQELAIEQGDSEESESEATTEDNENMLAGLKSS